MCLGAVFTALSLEGGSIIERLPAELQARVGENPGGALGYGAMTLGLVELIGPLRFGLTVAATPAVSKVARQYVFVQEFEAWTKQKWEGLMNAQKQV